MLRLASRASTTWLRRAMGRPATSLALAPLDVAGETALAPAWATNSWRELEAAWRTKDSHFTGAFSTSAGATPRAEPPVQRLFQTSQPRSLRTEEAFIKLEANDKSFLGRLVLQVGGFYSKESELIRGSNSLLKMTLDHCENSGVREALHLEDDFRTKHAFTCLHVWMVLRRLRKSGSEGKRVSQFFYDNFQHEVELSVHREGVRVRVNKWLRQLEDIFFGAAKAYDDAIDKHTEDFADVLYRNLYSDKGNREYCNALARYTIREMVSLSMTDTEAVLSGQVKFNASTD